MGFDRESWRFASDHVDVADKQVAIKMINMVIEVLMAISDLVRSFELTNYGTDRSPISSYLVMLVDC